jgi:Fic family protein
MRFEQLARHLLEVASPQRAQNVTHELTTFAFFEAYFSNFIEGTEFTLQEAEEIVFEGVIPRQRPQDAHDIVGTYRIIADPFQRARVPGSADELIELLREHHATILAERPDVGPGEFKLDPNRAGATQFVAPEFVEGTLRESWRLYEPLPAGFARAAFAMFAVSEVHPFADGNGRIARVLMNAELSAEAQQRIIVPTALRGDYLSGLRAMTHNGFADTYVSVLSALQEYTHVVDFSSRPAAELDLHRRRAFDDPSQQPNVLARVLGQAEPESR